MQCHMAIVSQLVGAGKVDEEDEDDNMFMGFFGDSKMYSNHFLM